MLKEVASFIQLKGSIVTQQPLLHHLTNYVTANDCANVALCIGAAPVMADALEEVEAMAGAAAAVVINMGTINPEKFTAMRRAQEVALAAKKPVILDPVGVMATKMRLRMAHELLEQGVTILRGNVAEIGALMGITGLGSGVDARGTTNTSELAAQAARTFHCVVAVTGAVDTVSDGTTTLQAANGVSLLARVTGTGCMTTTLMAAAAAVTTDYVSAALFGLTAMNVAAEMAQAELKATEGPAAFKVKLFDYIYNLSGSALATRYRGVAQEV